MQKNWTLRYFTCRSFSLPQMLLKCSEFTLAEAAFQLVSKACNSCASDKGPKWSSTANRSWLMMGILHKGWKFSIPDWLWALYSDRFFLKHRTASNMFPVILICTSVNPYFSSSCLYSELLLCLPSVILRDCSTATEGCVFCSSSTVSATSKALPAFQKQPKMVLRKFNFKVLFQRQLQRSPQIDFFNGLQWKSVKVYFQQSPPGSNPLIVKKKGEFRALSPEVQITSLPMLLNLALLSFEPNSCHNPNFA